MSAAWGSVIEMPRDITRPGTMLVDGKACPTHQIIDCTDGFIVMTGETFWMRVLEALSSSTAAEGLQHTDFNLVVASIFQHTCVSSLCVLSC